MIVPVLLRIDHETHADEHSLDGMSVSSKPGNQIHSLQATVLDLDTGEFRTYKFKSVQTSQPDDDVGLYLHRGKVDDQMRRLRAGLDRWLGGELDDTIDLERVKAFVRSASPKEVGAVMGTCLGVLDERGDADIATLLRALTDQTEQLLDEFRRQDDR